MGGTSYRKRGANLATAGLSAYSLNNHQNTIKPLSSAPAKTPQRGTHAPFFAAYRSFPLVPRIAVTTV